MAEQNFSAALATWKGERFSHLVPTASSHLNTFELLTCFYIEINLSELQKNLDTTAVELVDNQKENLIGRKKLAEQTRGTFPFRLID